MDTKIKRLFAASAAVVVAASLMLTGPAAYAETSDSRLLDYASGAEVTVDEAADIAVAYLSLTLAEQETVLAHYGQTNASQARILVDGASGMAPDRAKRAVPVVAVAALVGCLGSVGLSTYQAFKGGDPVEYIAGLVIGCVPLGPVAPALKPAVVAAINAAKPAVIAGLKALGVAANSALILALEGDS